ncbi:hypothetical protein D1224_01220 [Henriciella barbarensis]|uniref:Uncharacterized protein n=1 Tax=Henriciella barbarensis TaxID=86342 RepID=A0A399R9T0_9PROT|nr:hypothetical protein D1224_01220 [Henriciella barbarensis]
MVQGGCNLVASDTRTFNHAKRDILIVRHLGQRRRVSLRQERIDEKAQEFEAVREKIGAAVARCANRSQSRT